jgi:hypothetical protein
MCEGGKKGRKKEGKRRDGELGFGSDGVYEGGGGHRWAAPDRNGYENRRTSGYIKPQRVEEIVGR